MAKVRFEWDPKRDQENQRKHGVAFAKAQVAFADRNRIIAEDLSHSSSESRYYCFGAIEGGVLAVRFTYREDTIRIFGAGYWRRGKAIYEKENRVRNEPLGHLRIVPDFLPGPEGLVFREEGVKGHDRVEQAQRRVLQRRGAQAQYALSANDLPAPRCVCGAPHAAPDSALNPHARKSGARRFPRTVKT